MNKCCPKCVYARKLPGKEYEVIGCLNSECECHQKLIVDGETMTPEQANRYVERKLGPPLVGYKAAGAFEKDEPPQPDTTHKARTIKNFHCSEHGSITPHPVCPKCSPQPDTLKYVGKGRAEKDLEQKFNEKFPGAFYQLLTLNGVGSSVNVSKEILDFLKEELFSLKSQLIERLEGERKMGGEFGFCKHCKFHKGDYEHDFGTCASWDKALDKAIEIIKQHD